jgi:hypothetical protein
VEQKNYSIVAAGMEGRSGQAAALDLWSEDG